MYQVDFHYGLTFYLALKAGFSRAQAETIAVAAESLDQDPERDPIRTTLRAIGNAVMRTLTRGPRGADKRAKEAVLRERLRSDHFPRSETNREIVTAFSQEAQRGVIAAMRSGQLFAFGEGLHTLQDSVSHRGEPSLFGMSGHPNGRGGWISKNTDIPHMYPRQASDAAQATYNYLAAFRNKRGPQVSQPSWVQIKDEVAGFVGPQERNKKGAWLRARGVTMPEEYWNDVSIGPKESAARKAVDRP